jgi:hypothetical protein
MRYHLDTDYRRAMTTLTLLATAIVVFTLLSLLLAIRVY